MKVRSSEKEGFGGRASERAQKNSQSSEQAKRSEGLSRWASEQARNMRVSKQPNGYD